MYIVQAFSLFMIGLNIEPKISIEKSKRLRQCSSFIYYVHVILLYNWLDVILMKFCGRKIFFMAMDFFKICYCVIFICYIVLVNKKINNKKLNFLING